MRRPVFRLVLPIALGGACAQTPPSPAYAVASIHASRPGQRGTSIAPGPQGGVQTSNTTAIDLLGFAYDARDFQFTGVPGWASADHFDLILTPSNPETPPARESSLAARQAWDGRNRERMQAVLHDRFGLLLRQEDRTLPVDGLRQLKTGAKLVPWDGKTGPSLTGGRGGTLIGTGSTIQMLADALSSILGRPIVNETGLDGQFNFKLEWNPRLTSMYAELPDAAASALPGASIFSALTDQLGLQLKSSKGPVRIYVIEKIAKPGEN